MNEQNLPVLSARDVSFRLCGSIEVIADGRRIDLGEPKERALLGALLLAKSKKQPQDDLMKWLWDEPLPDGAQDEFWRTVSRTRKRLGGLGFVLDRVGKLYSLEVSEERVDVHVFAAMVQKADSLLHTDDRQAVALFRQALDLTSGTLLADVEGRRIDGLRQQWAATRRQAMLKMAKARLRLGEHHELISELLGEHHRNPYDEAILELLMIAYYRAGDGLKARQLYRDLKRRLAKVHSTDTMRRLDALYERMMKRDPDLEPPAEETPTTESGPAPEEQPKQAASAAAGTHYEFHEKVVAPHAVFGVSNTYRSR
uniref:AfsR/SARP family transcriptional regulator n=1 Tax=Herbidospora sakaeratensis TaxID=564415 RepID=UPI0007820C2A|nr:bacterial transcriptional activator domain-containing protein [Herbidospora sakaeratensis]